MKKVLIFAGLALVLVGAPLLTKYTRSGNDSVSVSAQTVERKIIKSSILSSGTLAYRQQVQLRSEVIAQVTGVHVEEADPVSKGDLVISLNTESYDAQVEQAQARVRIQRIAMERQQLMIENLERRYRNASTLSTQNLLDDDTVENLGNELSMSRVDLRSLQESLSQASAALAQSQDLLAKTQIESPIDGLVIQVDIKVGETVIAGTTNIPGSTLMIIADPSEMLVEVKVDEADIAMVREGQSADIYAAAYPDTPLSGTVESIATTARQTPGQRSLTFLVKILLDKSQDMDFRSGMSARADIYTETSEETISVPIQAVRFDDDVDPDDEDAETQPYVFVIEEGKALRKDVKTGISSDSDQEVLSGINEGDLIVTGPFRVLRDLYDGDPVEVEEDDDDEDQES